MNTLILHPTDISQWYTLVNEAQATTGIVLHENTESYLVFLLIRFSQNTELLESILALDFFESQQQLGKRQSQLLKTIGDKSLLLCGLFPGIIKKRHLSLNYYQDLGQAAYLGVGECEETALAKLYYELSQQFGNLRTILEALRA